MRSKTVYSTFWEAYNAASSLCNAQISLVHSISNLAEVQNPCRGTTCCATYLPVALTVRYDYLVYIGLVEPLKWNHRTTLPLNHPSIIFSSGQCSKLNIKNTELVIGMWILITLTHGAILKATKQNNTINSRF